MSVTFDPFVKFRQPAIAERQIDTLIGLCKGVVADGVVNQDEAEFLRDWLAANEITVRSNPVTYLGGKRYAVSFFGVVDLLAIVPALVVQDALALRILRLLRIFTLFKRGRIGGAARRLGEALRTVKEEFLLVGVSAVTVLFVAAFGIRYFEQEAQPEAFSNYADCLWWAVSSLITGEYGDVAPVTTGGKAFATIILILSLAIIAAPAGLIASALSQTPREQARADAEQRGT